jgi:hypothetical protein
MDSQPSNPATARVTKRRFGLWWDRIHAGLCIGSVSCGELSFCRISPVSNQEIVEQAGAVHITGKSALHLDDALHIRQGAMSDDSQATASLPKTLLTR